MIWRKADADDIIQVAENMRERDLKELLAVSFCKNKEELVKELSFTWNSGNANTVVFGTDENPRIAIFAYTPLRKGVWSIGLIATDEFNKIYISMTKWFCKKFINHMDKCKAHRIECQSIDGYNSIHNWLEFIGLKRETMLKGYGKEGENFIQFSWVRNKDEKNLQWIKSGVIESCV